MIPEHRAAEIMLAAIHSHRCAELYEALSEGGAATVESDGTLVIISADFIQQLAGGS